MSMADFQQWQSEITQRRHDINLVRTYLREAGSDKHVEEIRRALVLGADIQDIAAQIEKIIAHDQTGQGEPL